MLKRTAVCALCALVLISALAGCGETPAPGTSGSPAPAASPGASAEPMLEYDWEGAWQAYPLDAVVMTVNGEDVTWAEFFHWYAPTAAPSTPSWTTATGCCSRSS